MATILQVAGAVVVSVGTALIWPPLGVILAGVGMLVFGLALERK